MDDQRIHNINVRSQDVLPTPTQIKSRVPVSVRAQRTVIEGRRAVERILNRQDHRLLLIVGPCSIHDPAAALDYARRLKALADELRDTFLIVMRTYFEKPRTITGWKGLINDPQLDGSLRIARGLQLARRILLDVNDLGLPAATEALDPICPQYLSDLVTWTAIGARTTESQTHREMASGLSTPVGFKNGTDGGLQVAINALLSARQPHSFLGIDQTGAVAIVRTRGNPHGHIVLRGGSKGPNYNRVSIAMTEKELLEHQLPLNIMVDCSHANSNKDPALQPLVMQDLIGQIVDGNRSIVGAMLESNINSGNQTIPHDLSQLKYGVSLTDGCMEWSTTQVLLRESAARLRHVLPRRALYTAQFRSLLRELERTTLLSPVRA
jgi:3-deoxy-7-phosphoheptulonate synthase